MEKQEDDDSNAYEYEILLFSSPSPWLRQQRRNNRLQWAARCMGPFLRIRCRGRLIPLHPRTLDKIICRYPKSSPYIGSSRQLLGNSYALYSFETPSRDGGVYSDVLGQRPRVPIVHFIHEDECGSSVEPILLLEMTPEFVLVAVSL